MRHLTGAAVAALVAAAGPASAQTAIGELNAATGITIEGRVTDVFGNKFVLEDDTGRVLVETGPSWWRTTEVAVGERVTVMGEPDQSRTFDAFSIIHEDGREITIRKPGAPAPWAGQTEPRAQSDGDSRLRRRADADDQREIDAAGQAGIDLKKIAQDAGYVFGYDVDRKNDHYEVEAYDSNGVEVELHIDFTGRITRVEMDDPTYDEAGLRQIVESAGYAWRGDIDRKKKHYEVEAVNGHGERVELHVDYSGEIYKEKWD